MKKLILATLLMFSISAFGQGVLRNRANSIQYLWGASLERSMDKQGLSVREASGHRIQFVQTNKVILTVDFTTLTTPSYSTIDSVIFEVAGWIASYKVDSAIYSDTALFALSGGGGTFDTTAIYNELSTKWTKGGDSLKTGSNYLGSLDNRSLRIGAGGVSAMYIDSANRRIIIGGNDALATRPFNLLTTSTSQTLYINGYTGSNNDNAPSILLQRNRGTVVGTMAATTAGNLTGSYQFGATPALNSVYIGARLRSYVVEQNTLRSSQDLRISLSNSITSNSYLDAMIVHPNGNIGFANGENAAPTSPTYNLSFQQGGNVTIGGERSTSGNGFSMTLRGLDAQSGSTNATGGSAIISTGTSTGSAGSKVEIKNVVSGQDTGITDRTPTTAIEVADVVTFNRNVVSDTITTEYIYIKNKAHGHYAFQDSAILLDLTQNVWQQITNATGTLFTAVQDGEGFTISGDSIYFDDHPVSGLHPHIYVNWAIGGTPTANNKIFEFRIRNVTDDRGIIPRGKIKAGANDFIDISRPSYDVQADFGDVYIMEMRNVTDNTDFTVDNAVIYLEVSHY
jgi:hypothetical protein